VFNDILQSNRAMKRAAILEGTIVGYGCEPIPAREGSATVPVQLTLVDTLGREITAEIHCSVEHKTKDERAALQATKSRVPESLQEEHFGFRVHGKGAVPGSDPPDRGLARN